MMKTLADIKKQEKRPFGREDRLLLHIVERGKAPCNYRPPRL